MARIPPGSRRQLHRPPTLAAAISLLLLAAARPLPAQQPTLPAALQPRVRISSPRPGGSAIVANLVGVTGDSLMLRRSPEESPLALALESVGRIEVSQGRHARTGRGALIGFLTGTALGTGLVVAAASADDSGMNDGVAEFAAFVLGSGIALAGVGIGALVGSAIHTEEWREVPISQLRVGAGAHGGMAISVRVGTRR